MEITPPHKMFTLLNTSYTAYIAFIAYSTENAITVANTPRYNYNAIYLQNLSFSGTHADK